MLLQNIYPAKFLERKNRFVWKALLDDKEIDFHIWDTGRLKELLFEWNEILLQKLTWWNRKYKFRLIAARWLLWDFILLNSLLHSALVREYLNFKWINFKPEVKIGVWWWKMILNDEVYVEIKGCSLIKKQDNEFVGMFPDAPTSRWQKHIQELINILKNWKKAEIWFLLTNNVNKFKPNFETDEIFSKLFYEFTNNWWKVKFLYCNLEFSGNKVQLNLEEKNVEILYTSQPI